MMMVLKVSLVFAFCGLVLATPTLAREIYECKFPKVGNNMGYLPDTVMLAREDGSETVSLVDPFIQGMKGGPIELKIAAENSAKLSVSWPLMLQSTTNSYVNMSYRISIQKSSLAASLTGRPQGYANNFTAQGKCKRLEG
jgi:hypothetical protein